MKKLFTDEDKYADGEGPAVVEAFHSSLKELARRKLDESGVAWRDFVFGKSYDLITKADFEAIDRRVLDSGYRYTPSATISLQERPEAYKPLAGGGDSDKAFSFEHPEAQAAPTGTDGREQRGQGDNVVQFPTNVTGVARYYRTVSQVMATLTEGVPPDTIAIIDDSGGTLTAPILEHFKGVICAGGTVRSHLGILTREFGIPCLMNAKISGIYEGDTVELEVSGKAKSTEDYQQGIEVSVRVWKHQPK